jgi:hypothetical protein
VAYTIGFTSTNGLTKSSSAEPLSTVSISAPAGTAFPSSGSCGGAYSYAVNGGAAATCGAVVQSGGGTAAVTVNSSVQVSAGDHVVLVISGVTNPGSGGPSDLTLSTSSDPGVAHVGSVTPAPTVTAVAPTSGPAAGGTSVTITGTNLTGATAVHFGAALATALVVHSATSVTATSPAGTGTVDITVTTAGGTSAIGAADRFTYVASSPSPPVRHCAISAVITGGKHYTLKRMGLCAALHLTFNRKHKLVAVHATYTVPGANGGTATVVLALVKGRTGWTGTVRVSDPTAHLTLTFHETSTPVLTSALVSGSGITTVLKGTTHVRVVLHWSARRH